jgi:hypothetical protein
MTKRAKKPGYDPEKARKRKKTNITLSPEERRIAEKIMKKTGLSLSRVVAQMIRKTARELHIIQENTVIE